MGEAGPPPPPPAPPPVPASLLAELAAMSTTDGARYKSAGKGVSLVVNRCEAAKASGLLDLKSCELVSFPDAIYVILMEYEIKQLSLACNKFKRFPKRIPEKFDKLLVLSLKENALTEFPEELENFARLKAIDLADNHFSTFPGYLLQQANLKIVNLANNQIQSVDVEDVFGKLENLQMLNLAGNPLTDSTREAIAQSQHKDKIKLE